MQSNLYDLSVPLLLNGLKNLITIIEKGQQFCVDNTIDESVLINDRLHSTMLPLGSQVSLAIVQATHSIRRMLGESEVEVDASVSATTFAELTEQISEAIAYLESVEAGALNPAADKSISYIIAQYRLSFPSAYIYLQKFVFPNFYFHTTTAYDILRHNGVALSKGEFLGDMGGSIEVLEG